MVKRLSARLLAATMLLTGAQVDAAGPAAPGTPVTVRTSEGAVVGRREQGYLRFMGIPFAAPPTGALRWRPPQPAKPWSKPRDASKAGAKCPQIPMLSKTDPSFEEDCLFLNVYAPTGGKRAKPVMVWVHGGGFTAGSGDTYDGRRIAMIGDVVVVTINYRMGVFGFFSHPELEDSGDFGLQDQQEALRWVRRNAAAFGGDPRNITLFGESAGGMSVCAHLAAPGSKGLFDKAIIQSGACMMGWPKSLWLLESLPHSTPYISREVTDARGRLLAERLNCDSVACLRGKSTADLLKETTGKADMGFAQIVFGGPAMPIDPAQATREGKLIHMPVMLGGTRDEQNFVAAFREKQQPVTPERYLAMLGKAFDERAGEVAAEYPHSAYPSPALAWAAAGTDVSWACPNLENDRLLAEKMPVYAYEFADVGGPSFGSEPPAVPLGASHGSELPYFFDIEVNGKLLPLAPPQARLGETMIRYWTNFARTGDPNGKGLPQWPRFETRRSTTALSLAAGDKGIAPVDLEATHRCTFWTAFQGSGG